jgi:hypothetical protein
MKQFLKKVTQRLSQSLSGHDGTGAHDRGDDSPEIRDRAAIEAFTANPENTFLVSFPRTGSHWLRMLMELYFERPSLRRVFFYPEVEDYLTLHTHDLDLTVERRRVIYLYREPVATIYSQLRYHEEDTSDIARVHHWSELYGRHLDKWLAAESFTTQKTLLRYDRLKADTAAEFAKVCAHVGEPFEAGHFGVVAEQVSKQRVKERTAHDPQVVKLERSYEEARRRFRASQGPRVWAYVLDGRPHLEAHFEDTLSAP